MAVASNVDVVMPQMGSSVTEGTISRWLKQVGDTVQADETIVEISTDKVDTEVPSPAGGVVVEILVAEGVTVDVGTRIAVLSTDPNAAPAAPAAPAEPAPAPPA
ncbi:MAG: biotin/lipoyl-containing protein, partial [Actinomycetota bacterium]